MSEYDISPKPGDGVRMTESSVARVQQMAMKAARQSALSPVETITIRGAARSGAYQAARADGREPTDSDLRSAEYRAIDAAIDAKLAGAK